MARMMSMCTDKNDDTQFRHGINQKEGTDTGDPTVGGTFGFGQVCPFFFNNEGASIFLDGMYRGATCFLVGGGPSLLKEDYKQLYNPGVLTLGMNNSAKTVRPNMWACVDDPCRFLYSIWRDPKIMKFIPQAALKKPLWNSTFVNGEQIWKEVTVTPASCPNVIGYRRNEKFCAKRFLTEDTINWGCHKDFGGCRSVMLAALRIMFLLGIRRVFMVGVDLKMDDENKYSFPEGRSASAIRNNNNTYKRMLTDYFPQLKPEFDKWGYQVFCCNKDSDVCNIFPHVPFQEAINSATAEFGDVSQEKTEGMYLAIDEKRKHSTYEACVTATS